jgi:alanine or glycine:cation symporter, AGCS family
MQHLIDTLSGGFTTFLIIPLIGTGIYLTFRLKLVQLFKFGHSWGVISGKYDNPDDEGDISHLQALSAALSATIGIGNIAGVATAIHFGGPGALFWMWVTAALGMATKFSEATLAMTFRKIHKDGSASGGPMYYIEQGLGKGWKPLAVIFAVATVISSFGTGNSIQAFTVADSMKAEFNIPTVVTGLVLASIVAMVILGGIKRIGVVASRLVPFMALAYIVGACFVVFKNADQLPTVFATIFSSAFSPQGAVGGFTGSTFFLAILWGVRRGIYSNESGQGSAPIAHAAAKTDEPVREGTVAMIGPFIDTLVICTLTGLAILTSGAWHTHYPTHVDMADPVVVLEGIQLEAGANFEEEYLFDGFAKITSGKAEGLSFIHSDCLVKEPLFVRIDEVGTEIPLNNCFLNVYDGKIITVCDGNDVSIDDVIFSCKTLRNGSLLTSQAFESALGKNGSLIVTLGVFLFAISTAISWSYYGDRAAVYLFGNKGILPYRIVYVFVVFIGANLALKTVWGFGDIALSIMAIPNLIALVLLAPKIKALKEDYFSRKHEVYKG